MKYFILFICFLFLFSFFPFRKEKDHGFQANRLIKKIEKIAFKKYGLRLFGRGGAFMDQINGFNLSFYAKGERNIDEMRFLLFNLTIDFLELINSDNDVREYLVEYPFGYERLKLIILLYDKNGKSIVNPGSSKEKLSLAYIKKNKVYYRFMNEEKKCYQKFYEETYQEALEKVIKQPKIIHEK